MNSIRGSVEGVVKQSGMDWILFATLIPLLSFGLFTINSFSGENILFERQILWISISLFVFFVGSFLDFRFLRRTSVVATLFVGTIFLLGLLFVLGSIFHGAQSWFNFGVFAFQPSDPAKLVLILVLAKYFSKRHVEIAHIRHIVVSGFYAGLMFLLVFLQPDFGSAIIIFCLWFGMVLVSGISRKHLFLVLSLVVLAFLFSWTLLLHPYQKLRIVTFLHPLTDIRGAGYNAYQSMIAIGSGEVVGKGVGYGTQSKLKFLPEYETDFVFAAFAEEWGFVGVLFLFLLFGIVVWRIVLAGLLGATNFEALFAAGLAILFISHFVIHIGMNIGLLPVTGTTIPFLSYGGSHVLTEFLGLGILMGMRRYGRGTHREVAEREVMIS